jgi:hypothetical protein
LRLPFPGRPERAEPQAALGFAARANVVGRMTLAADDLLVTPRSPRRHKVRPPASATASGRPRSRVARTIWGLDRPAPHLLWAAHGVVVRQGEPRNRPARRALPAHRERRAGLFKLVLMEAADWVAAVLFVRLRLARRLPRARRRRRRPPEPSACTTPPAA